MNMLKSKLQVPVTLVFLGFVGWWLSFQSVVKAQGVSVQWFGGTYGIMALIAAIIGFSAAHKWGGFKTVLGRALLFFSFGLLAQEAGQLIYTYYVYGAKVDIPYPSWGDAAYFGSVIFYITGAVFLTKVAGIKFSLKHSRYKLIAFLVPAVLLMASYWVFLHNHDYDFSKPITVGLDAGYPLGEAIYISLGLTAYLLSRKLLGGLMKAGILLVIVALFLQYISDFTFLYQTSRNTWIAGRFDDLFYLIAYFAFATAMIKFHMIYSGLSAKSTPPHQAADTEIKQEVQ
ncbi:MAG: hypothetical protein WA843_04615 [Candidatus Saccharimonadales bacterium]